MTPYKINQEIKALMAARIKLCKFKVGEKVFTINYDDKIEENTITKIVCSIQHDGYAYLGVAVDYECASKSEEGLFKTKEEALCHKHKQTVKQHEQIHAELTLKIANTNVRILQEEIEYTKAVNYLNGNNPS